MNNYESICYRKSYLDQVIVRLDFMDYIESEKIHCKEIEQEIIKIFPRRGKEQTLNHGSIDFSFDPRQPEQANAKRNILLGIQKQYFSANQKNQVIISNMYLIFDIREYISFDQMNGYLKSIIQTIFTYCKPTVVRTGLRYINLYKNEDIKLKKKFFSSEIAACLITKFERSSDLTMMRSMHLTEYKSNNLLINFRYGMFNSNYPSPMRDNSFSLDYDCFSTDTFSTSDDVLEILQKGHGVIQKLFEASITDQLREEMKGE